MSPACKTETHQAIPAWNGLLQVYGALYLPVIFALLFQINLEAYVQARINYEVREEPRIVSMRLMAAVRNGIIKPGDGLPIIRRGEAQISSKWKGLTTVPRFPHSSS